MRLRDDADGLAALISGVAVRTGIPAIHVEKDFWLTEALRGMAAYADQRRFTLLFKGGTSLSKAFRIIQRFSEDVDVLVVLPTDTRTARDRCLKALVAAAASACGLAATTVPSGTTTGLKRAARLEYPTPTGAADLGELSRGVLLEIGSRGGTLPNKRHVIRSLVAEHTRENLEGYEESIPFEVPVLSPARTLVEKVVLLHTVHAPPNPDPDRAMKTARHYYDVYRLLHQVDVCAALRDMGVDAIARDVVTYSVAADLPAEPRPSGGFAHSPAFDGGPQLDHARYAYERVIDQLVWPGAERPTFAECLAAVQTAADLL